MKKKFDCVKMKDEIQAGIQAETRGMSHAEEIVYIHKLARRNRKLWRKFSEASAAGKRR